MNAYSHIRSGRSLLLGVLLFMSMSVAWGGMAFDKANTQYKKGHYAEAADLYRQAIRAEGENAVNCYNLGNACFKLKDYPAAVLYYEKSLKHDPADEHAAFNLKLARDKALTKIESDGTFFVIRFISDQVHGYGARTWSVLLLMMLWAGVLSLLLYFRKEPGQGGAYRSLGLVALVLAVAFFLVARHRYAEQRGNTHAVIMRQQAELKAEPVQAAKTTIRLEAGNTVELLDRDAGWYKVELPNGRTGWIAVEDLALI